MTLATRFVTLCLAALILAAAGTGRSADAFTPASEPAASPWVETEQTAVRLIAAPTATGDAATVRLGLHFRLQPGWKVYWRSPGAAGFPPAIDWSDSDNVAAAAFAWPAPHRFSVLGLDTLGYSDEVVLPIDVRLARPGEPLIADAQLTYLTCSDICIPYDTRLSLALPSGPAGPSAHDGLIERFAARVPGDGVAAGLGIERAAVVGDPGAQVLRVVARAERPFAAPDLFVEGPSRFEFLQPAVSLGDGGRTARLEVPVATVGGDRPDLAGAALTLTLVDGDRALETEVAAVPGPAVAESAGAIAGILALALLGGLILNLMPCVLPVLSLKLLSVVGHGGAERSQVRRGFLATAAGILFSFVVLAAGLIAVRAGGLAVGWGIQFQQPLFLVGMALVLTLFAANLWGAFEFRLPGVVADRAAGGPAEPTMAGHFATGAFATLLATPCSAPFLGTAVGFALSRGAGEILAVFVALGIGLALPYLAVAAFPGLAVRLPRPGPWMDVLRKVLGVALAATVVWLLSVLATQAGMAGALAASAALLVLLAAVFAAGRLAGGAARAGAAFAVAAALAAFLAPGLAGSPGPATEATADSRWSPFRPDDIPGLVRAGNVIFVDVTADWCLTCQVNKRLVLDAEPVAGRLAAAGVVPMRADWTRPDDRIADFLAEYGRYGIPFNVVFGPGAPRGVPLPELLTTDAVMAAIRRAAASG